MLFDSLKEANGIGLASPQINLLKRAFVIDTTILVKDDLTVEKIERVYINPLIVDSSSEPGFYKEGCLSFPGIFEDVERPEKILVRYQDQSLNTIEEELDGLQARIFQHEYDHLSGILFIDRLSLLKRKLLTRKLYHIRRR